MALTGDFARLAKLRRDLASLGKPDGVGQKTILRSVGEYAKIQIRDEFSSGIGADGPWKDTVRGNPALISKRLPQLFVIKVIAGAVIVRALEFRRWLMAHQEGHTFPARSVRALKQIMRRDAKGRLISAARLRRIQKSKGGVAQAAGDLGAKKKYSVSFAPAHVVKQRTLPARLIYPVGGLTPAWQQAVERGVIEGMQQFAEKASK